MKILALSDTHGKLDKALKVCDVVSDADLVIHLGDHKSDGDEIAKAKGIDVIAVKGNCDGGYSENDYEIVSTPSGKILLIHGHMQNVKSTLQNLLCRTRELGCKAAVFGHTHKPCIEEVNGTYLINPGSLPLPADGGNGSYAVIEATENAFSASIVFYDCIEALRSPSGAKPKATGGYLRNLLNNSDRF